MERDQHIKADDGKPMLELVPPKAIIALGKVMTYGAKKYEPMSWRSVGTDRYTGALMRHMMAYMNGEVYDRESGMPHMWHVLTNAAFITDLEYDHLPPQEVRDAVDQQLK